MRGILKDPDRRATLLLVLVLGAFGITFAIVDSNDDGRPDTLVVHVDGGDRDAKRDDPIKLDPSAQAGLERAIKGETATELDEPLKQPGDAPETIPGPLAADELPGCRTAFVRNQSRRSGYSAPRVIVWHQTVSHENGWSSQNALTGLANRPSSGVSWHALVGRSEGRCTYTVPLLMKAWHASNANSFTAGIEVEAQGDEGAYVTGAGKAKLLSITRHIGKRYGIPMRHAVVHNCKPITSGILEHSELGPCGGGHIDVTLTSSVQELFLIHEAAQATASSTSKPNTATERSRCGGLAHHRRVVRRHRGKWGDTLHVRGKRTSRGRRARYLKAALKRAHVDERRYCS